jgi:phosphonate transport system substrate-binding protein
LPKCLNAEAEDQLRRLLFCLALIFVSPGPAVAADDATRALRVGLTPGLLNDQHRVLADLRSYLIRALGRRVDIVLRDSYRETMDLLRLKQLDFAWICDYPYLYLKSEVRLLAVPVNNGKPLYRSYIIVPATDTRSKSLGDLKGTVFAFADPYSNTGYLYPRYALTKRSADPNAFFGRTFFTWSHRGVVEAVATGLAQGGAVDSYVWDALAELRPELTGRTRIVERSPEFGFPPLVAHRSVSDADFRAMQRMLLDMPSSPHGAEILRQFRLDGFVEGSPKLYDGVAAMMRAFGEQ